MERDKIFEKIVEICKDVFNNNDLLITETSTAADVEEWDSLTHLSLINELEKEFNIAFLLDEINGSQNMGELVNVIIKHMAEK